MESVGSGGVVDFGDEEEAASGGGGHLLAYGLQERGGVVDMDIYPVTGIFGIEPLFNLILKDITGRRARSPTDRVPSGLKFGFGFGFGFASTGYKKQIRAG